LKKQNKKLRQASDPPSIRDERSYKYATRDTEIVFVKSFHNSLNVYFTTTMFTTLTHIDYDAFPSVIIHHGNNRISGHHSHTN